MGCKSLSEDRDVGRVVRFALAAGSYAAEDCCIGYVMCQILGAEVVAFRRQNPGTSANGHLADRAFCICKLSARSLGRQKEHTSSSIYF
jgi:hypothetical protein